MTIDRFERRLTLGLLAAATLMLATPARGQLPVISGGTHVKLWLGPDQPRIKGTLFSQTVDTVRVTSDGEVRVIPTSMIGGVEVGGGRSHTAGAWRGAKIGAMILGGAGAVIFGSSYAAYEGKKQPGDLAAVVVASALSGAFYGAIIGAIAGSEAWTPVYPARVAVSLARPTPNATSVGLSFKF